MKIKFACPMCSKTLATDEDRAGRRVRCPQCNNAVTVPEPPAEKPPEAAEPADLGFSELLPDKQALKSQLDKLKPATRKALLIGGIAGAALLFGCCGIGIIGMIFSGSKQPTESTAPGEKILESDLASFSEVPPPIIDLVRSEVTVWEMTNWWISGEKSGSDVDSSLYVAIRDGRVDGIYVKYHVKKGATAKLMSGEERHLERDLIRWEHLPFTKPKKGTDLSNTQSEWSHEIRPDGFALTYTFKMETDTARTTTVQSMSAVIDREVNEGFWKGTKTFKCKYRGRMANLPDQDKEEELKGFAVLPVKARKK
ncbi:MAG: hypothetical protein U0791_04740 [Gemmataceae bacterium]